MKSPAVHFFANSNSKAPKIIRFAHRSRSWIKVVLSETQKVTVSSSLFCFIPKRRRKVIILFLLYSIHLNAVY